MKNRMETEKMKRKIIAGICITVGIALMAVPFYYHFHGQHETDRLIKQFEDNMEDDDDGTDGKTKEEKKEVLQTKEKSVTDSKETEAFSAGEEVVGIIEIDAIGIRYPIVEGCKSKDIAYAIGHMPDTAGIGEKGNCVLCGHNGSRNGSFFTKLNQVKKGEQVRLLDTSGKEHLYKVSETFIIRPYDNSVKEQTENEILTLLTCAEHGSKRYICKCEPIKEGVGDVDA